MQLNKVLRQEYREYYFYNRPTWDIEKQMTEGFEEEEGEEGEVREEEGEAADYVTPPIELHVIEACRDPLSSIRQSQQRRIPESSH